MKKLFSKPRLAAVRRFFSMTHSYDIKKGKLGDVSKIREEVEELDDAYVHDQPMHAIVEAADVIGAVGHFTRAKYRVPLLLVVLMTYVRVPYKLGLKIRDAFRVMYLKYNDIINS